MPEIKFSVSEFLAVCNQTLDYAYANVVIEGEVSSYKVNQGKWVFFDLKDGESSINCFMALYQLRMPLEDGMKVIVRGTPKITKWGKFSFTVQTIMPVGEGNIKKSFELLKKKLEQEGLFDPAKKRPIAKNPTRLGVISSTAAAGYADFIKIINARWGGINIQVAHTQVQGMDAADQIIRAIQYFNERAEVEAIAIIRGGGSADDLAVFNDEKLVRAVSASRIQIITGIGHEVDESLVDLAADLRASTPSNAAELLVSDRHAEIEALHKTIENTKNHLLEKINHQLDFDSIKQIKNAIFLKINQSLEQMAAQKRILEALNPEKVLGQGYAIVTGKISPGEMLKITTKNQLINAEVKDVQKRNAN